MSAKAASFLYFGSVVLAVALAISCCALLVGGNQPLIWR
jgi:hypothetical protein